MSTKSMPYPYVVKSLLLLAPVLLLPFMALLMETIIQVHVFQTDYRTTVLTHEIQSLQQEIKDLRAQEANLEALQRLEAMATELGLVAPSHNQIIFVDVPQSEEVPHHPMAFARLDRVKRGGNEKRVEEGTTLP